MDLSSLSIAQLEALRDAALDSITRSTGAQSYQIGSRMITRMSPAQAMEILSAVSREIDARTDTTGDMGVVEFGGAE